MLDQVVFYGAGDYERGGKSGVAVDKMITSKLSEFVTVVKVPEHGTSKICHVCSGHVTRHHVYHFTCGCGNQGLADLNAATNIAKMKII